ncbi:uroporphyrinogen decarboxylase [Nesterenkonia alkaliphila]|nr:uroporphyrinogen decarboxylase [Nesterenkonia alkaliphila]GFZ85013.1 uroporphyrinogen decarboxylase [Nesterenkonia alkaliphila]
MTTTPPAALPADHPLVAGLTADAPLLNQYRGGRDAAGRTAQPARRPVWFMRQAGRSLPEYRKLREGTSMLDSCLNPEMAAEITLQPVRRHDVDAAIFFSDIVIPLRLAGVGVEIKPGVGPVLDSPVRTLADVRALPEIDESAFAPIVEAVQRTTAGLAELSAEAGRDWTTPLIGFAGAPFTLAAYMVEGRPSKDHLAVRAMMKAQTETWNELAAWAARASGAFMRAQVLAGASAAQLFDSWAGSLSRADYLDYVAPFSQAALSHVADLKVPLIHFGTGTGQFLDAMRAAVEAALPDPAAGHPVLGVDYRLNLREVAESLGKGANGRNTPLQGNIDPALLFGDWATLEAHVRQVVAEGGAAGGHVVNLGHGVPPDTDPSVLTRVVELIHSIHP